MEGSRTVNSQRLCFSSGISEIIWGQKGSVWFRFRTEVILNVFRDGFACLGVRKDIGYPKFGQRSDGYSLLVKLVG